jgi:hypothetical protein
MSDWRNYLIVVLAAAAIYLIYQNREEPAPQTPAPPVVRTVSPKLASRPAPHPPTLAPQPPSEKIVSPSLSVAGGEHPNPPPKAVPFQVIDDWVVAYGDILIGKPNENEKDFPRSGFIEAPKLELWERGEIPYSIHSTLPNPERVLRVVQYFNQNTNLKLVPYNGQKDSIIFMPFNGLCLSYLGKIGGNQPIFLDDRCTDAEITHELMHAAGFIHEHSRADRDRFVRVNWKNIEDDKVGQFEISPESLNQPVTGRPFDYRSAMLYPVAAFAKDRSSWTLESTTGEKIDPVPAGLSPEDIERLKLLYRP